MYNTEQELTITFCDVEIDCICTVSTIHYEKGRTSIEDVIEEITSIIHKGEDITGFFSDSQLDDIQALCYEEYYR